MRIWNIISFGKSANNVVDFFCSMFPGGAIRETKAMKDFKVLFFKLCTMSSHPRGVGSACAVYYIKIYLTLQVHHEAHESSLTANSPVFINIYNGLGRIIAFKFLSLSIPTTIETL